MNHNVDELKQDLKNIIIIESDNEDEFTHNDINDDEPLVGNESAIGLDSLDLLQISVAIKKKYGVRIEGAKESRIAFESVSSLVNYIKKSTANNE
jgi:acyl carrier protein